MCGRLVNLDTVARVLADYYHLKTDKQLAALDEALSRVPAETVGKELFGNSEQLDDTISRRLAIEALAEWHDDAITNRLNNLPPAQPERKKGKWLPDNNNYYEERFICSVCGKSYKVDTCMGKPMWDFCPCGADMRGEQDE